MRGKEVKEMEVHVRWKERVKKKGKRGEGREDGGV